MVIGRNEKVAIGLRVPENLRQRLQKRAQELDISQNDLVLVLIEIGFKVWDSDFNLTK